MKKKSKSGMNLLVLIFALLLLLITKPETSSAAAAAARQLVPISNILLAPQHNSDSFSAQLWFKHKDQAIMSLYTPFIISLGAGNLPLATFEEYLYQDIHYLTAYAQAAYIAREFAPNEMTKNYLQSVGDQTIKYIESFASFFEELGLKYDPYNAPPKNEAAEKYIDFLLTLARTRVTVYTFAALTPCQRLYTYLGGVLNSTLTPEEFEANRYKRWIEENSQYDPEPEQKRQNLRSAKDLEFYLDMLSEGLPQEELDEIDKIYKQGLEHETQFFLANPIVGQQVVVPLWNQLQGLKFPLVSDFDLSTKKTSSDLEKIEAYEQSIAEELLRNDPPGKYSFAAIETAFKSVSEFEKTSFPNNVSFGQFEAESDCINLSLKVVKKDDQTASAYLISAYWSDDSIKSALEKEGLEGKISHAGNKGTVESSIDKLEAFIDILQKNDNEGNNLSLYIGDSVGDLLGLLTANIGVVYGSNENLEKVGEHFHISLVPLFRGLIDKQKEVSWKPSRNVIYSFTYWAEMEAFILGS